MLLEVDWMRNKVALMILEVIKDGEMTDGQFLPAIAAYC